MKMRHHWWRILWVWAHMISQCKKSPLILVMWLEEVRDATNNGVRLRFHIRLASAKKDREPKSRASPIFDLSLRTFLFVSSMGTKSLGCNICCVLCHMLYTVYYALIWCLFSTWKYALILFLSNIPAFQVKVQRHHINWTKNIDIAIVIKSCVSFIIWVLKH